MNNESQSFDITYVLFGSTGNLAEIKIFPALFTLFEKGIISKNSKIIAQGRRAIEDSQFRDRVKGFLKKYNQTSVEDFVNIIQYVVGDINDSDSYLKLKEHLIGNSYFHLSVTPENYDAIIKGLTKAKIKGNILIEKPFGHDLESAKKLQAKLLLNFKEEEIFQIDHYLGKIGLQRLFEERVHNTELENKLNNNFVSSIRCSFREVVDIQNRGEFYDATGAFRDMGQGHGLMVLGTILLENISGDKNTERQKALESLYPETESVVRGQYKGYTDSDKVAKDSTTETYFSLKLQSKSERWGGVPIILESGKALEKEERIEVVVVKFKNGDEHVFDLDIPKHFNAYEKIIEEAFRNDKSFFVSFPEAEASWKIADAVGQVLKDKPILYYNKGEGPKENYK